VPSPCKPALSHRIITTWSVLRSGTCPHEHHDLSGRKEGGPKGHVSVGHAKPSWIHKGDSKSMATPGTEDHDQVSLPQPGGQANRACTQAESPCQRRHCRPSTGKPCPPKTEKFKHDSQCKPAAPASGTPVQRGTGPIRLGETRNLWDRPAIYRERPRHLEKTGQQQNGRLTGGRIPGTRALRGAES
jgi:hypothetical protein